MKTTSKLLVTSLFLALFAAASPVSGADKLAGLKVGEKAPAFALKNQDGEMVQLKSLIKKGPVALVFYRSADWWPFCQKQLVQLQTDLGQIKKTGVALVGISYDDIGIIKGFSTKQKLGFPLLSDPGSKTITAYGLLKKDEFGDSDGLPHPLTMIVGTDGLIKAKLGFDGHRNRHNTEALLAEIENLKSE